MERFREAVVIFDYEYVPGKSKGYVVSCCNISPGGSGKERIEWDCAGHRILPDIYNPADDGKHFVALVTDGYSHPGISHAPIVAHSEEELQDKMYSRAIELANAESEWYKKPVEDRTLRAKEPGLEAVLSYISKNH